MHLIFSLIALFFGIGCLVCHILILVDAFQDELWKGLLGLLCGFYLLYYAFVEFDHEKKWQIILMWIFGGTLASIFKYMAR